MALTANDWINELEDAIVSHIDDYVTADVDIRVEAELPDRPFTKPVITITQVDGTRENTGGMNTVGVGQQGYWEKPSYYITVNTDRGDYDDNGRSGRNRIAAQLETIAFGIQLHILKAAVEATVINLRPQGVTPGSGPMGDAQVFQRVFMLDIEVIVPFTSVVI